VNRTVLRLVLTDLNPEPWKAALKGKNGFRKDEGLRSYQEAMKEDVKKALTDAGHVLPLYPKDTILRVHFDFWRQLEKTTIGGRTRRRQDADATNMQKAAEDALQGVVYHNDKMNRHVSSEILEVGFDTKPGVAIFVVEFNYGYEKLSLTERAAQMGHHAPTGDVHWSIDYMVDPDVTTVLKT
jgi:Holliday junction resolvase RusA-like endonuclease